MLSRVLLLTLPLCVCVLCVCQIVFDMFVLSEATLICLFFFSCFLLYISIPCMYCSFSEVNLLRQDYALTFIFGHSAIPLDFV